jgi:hypothetical protein
MEISNHPRPKARTRLAGVSNGLVVDALGCGPDRDPPSLPKPVGNELRVLELEVETAWNIDRGKTEVHERDARWVGLEVLQGCSSAGTNPLIGEILLVCPHVKLEMGILESRLVALVVAIQKLPEIMGCDAVLARGALRRVPQLLRRGAEVAVVNEPQEMVV